MTCSFISPYPISLESTYPTLLQPCAVFSSLLFCKRHGGIRASLATRGKLLTPPFIFFIHTFIYSLNEHSMNENGGTTEFIFCVQKINMGRTGPYLLDECHHLSRDS